MEEGLRVKEAAGEGEVVVISMGPARAADAVRKTLAMGADRAVLVTDESLENADLLVTARALAGVLEREGADLVLFGQQSADGDGACLWADPYRWVPEAARILRPGGELIFLVNAALLTLCVPEEDDRAAGDRLLRSAFGMYRIEWPGDTSVEFHLSHGDWLRLLRRSGFEIEDLIEVRAPEAGTTRYPFVTLEWARQWPSEEIWKARRRVDDTKRLDQA